MFDGGVLMEMLKTFVVRVELFAGVSIEDAAAEMCQLASRIGVRVEARFNGVTLWARPGDDAVKLAKAYHIEIQRAPNLYKIAQA